MNLAGSAFAGPRKPFRNQSAAAEALPDILIERAQGPLLYVLQSISVDIRKNTAQRKPLSSGTHLPIRQEQAGNKGMLPACPETDGLNAYFENCRPGSFGLPFFRRNRSSFEPVIETRPSIFWPSLRVRTRSFPSWV